MAFESEPRVFLTSRTVSKYGSQNTNILVQSWGEICTSDSTNILLYITLNKKNKWITKMKIEKFLNASVVKNVRK